MRPGMPEPVFANLTDRLRRIARGLAPARDAQALLDAVDKLERETGPATGPRPHPILARLAAQAPARGGAESRAKRRLRCHARPCRLRPALANLAVYPDDFRQSPRACATAIATSRQAFRHAFAEGRDEDFHEWRKTLQHHWRHMQLLAPVLALGAFGARRGGPLSLANPRRRPRHLAAGPARLRRRP